MNSQVENLMHLCKEEGYNRTPLKGVGVFKASASAPRGPMCYGQGIIIVVQGHKRVYLDHQGYDYNPDNYLVLTLPTPAECETFVEPGKPLLAMLIDIDLGLLGQLVRTFDEHGKLQSETNLSELKPVYVGRCTDSLSNSITRLSHCLRSPLECDVMGDGLIREVLFHILTGPQAAPLFALASHNTHLARIERALKHLHEHFSDSLDVEQLAAMANMSASTFHRNFRQITASSPIQYIKKLRLNRARELLLDQGLKVKQAAQQVGYESPTQFSREFKRYFGVSPQECHLHVG